jgi:hypothetical protein
MRPYEGSYASVEKEIHATRFGSYLDHGFMDRSLTTSRDRGEAGWEHGVLSGLPLPESVLLQ